MENNQLTVVCFLWGNWCRPHGPLYVRRLHDSVRRHLSIPHRFVCVTTFSGMIDSRIETRSFDVPSWMGNLPKIWMFKNENGLAGRILALDLDIVITGSLDDIAGYKGKFCTTRDFFHPQDGAGGSITMFRAGTLHGRLWAPLENAPDEVEVESEGSERLYYRQRIPDPDYWQDLYPGQIINYKIHGNKGPHLKKVPGRVRIVSFHGHPKPHEVARDIHWVRKHWR